MWLTQEAIIEQKQLKQALGLVTYDNGEVLDPDGNPIEVAGGGGASTGFNVKDYGAKGDGVADDSTAINAAITAANALASGGTVIFPSGTYLLAATHIVLKSNEVLWLYGAVLKLKDGASVNMIRIDASATKCGVYGGEINGNKVNCPAGGDGINTFLTGTGQINVTIRDVYIHDCKMNGISLNGISEAIPSKYITVSGCVLQSNDLAGLNGGFLEEVVFTNNEAINNVVNGINGSSPIKYAAISNNTISGLGSGANIYLVSGLNRNIVVSGNVSRGGNSNGITVGGQDIVVSNNMIYDPGTSGINCAAAAAAVSNNVTISSNVIESAGSSGIVLDKTNEFTVVGNTITNGAVHGMLLSATNSNGTVSGNTIKSNTIYGIALVTSNRVAITGNDVITNTSHGIHLDSSQDCSVVGNVCNGNGGQPFVSANSSDWNLVSGNNFHGNTNDIPVVVGANSMMSRDHLLTAVNTLASATALTLIPYTDYITITGTANITSIATSWARRFVTLKFQDGATITKGSNLKIAATWVTTANDTLSLVCDGIDWYEVSRSEN